MRPQRVALLIVGSLLALVSVGMLAGGGAVVGIHATQRDSDGFYSSDTSTFATSTYAVTSDDLDLGIHVDGDWAPFDDLGTVRVRVTGTDRGSVFVGIGPADRVGAYLAGSAHDRIVDVEGRDLRPTYERVDGEIAPAPPGDQTFWVASATGPGTQELRWDVASGTWAVVVMNADASRGVDVDANVGLKTGLLLPIGIGLLLAALVIGGLAAFAIVVAVRRRDEAEAASAVETGSSPSYPVRLRGELDPELNRWLWLVKWFLALPHILVLVLLWPAAGLLTVVAGFAILFTGRYPRSIFDFNVGVMRWSWRVTFYAFTFGTDRYPPFTLSDDPSYPAGLEIDPPGALSRGLVLVKWWLLALPHYLIVGVFGSGFTWWAWDVGRDGGWRAGGVGLVGLLVLIAGVALLFTRRYPQTIFDLVLGMQRWSYRVLAYAALMRDEYPPFRLDMGGTDPGSPPPPTDTASAQAA
jgi:hypothetical protein